MRAARTEEFERFVTTRSGALLRTAFLLTGDRGHAEDLRSEVSSTRSPVRFPVGPRLSTCR